MYLSIRRSFDGLTHIPLAAGLVAGELAVIAPPAARAASVEAVEGETVTVTGDPVGDLVARARRPATLLSHHCQLVS
jgi:hypothetical protein